MTETSGVQATETAQPTLTADAAPAAPATEPVASLLDGQATAPAGAAPEAAAPAEQPAPEPVDYLTALKLPEGVTAEDPYVAEVAGLFGEAKLPAEMAQKLIDFDAKRQADAVAKWQDEVTQLSAKYLQEVKADPEIGGDKLEGTLANIGLAVDKFVPADLKATLQGYGLGNHPALARLLNYVGKTLQEDRFVTGAPAPARRDPLSEWYPNQAKGA